MRLLISKSKSVLHASWGLLCFTRNQKSSRKKINTVSNALPYTCSIEKRASLARQATRGRQMLHIVPRISDKKHKLKIKFLKISRNILWHLWHLWHVGLSENPMFSWKTRESLLPHLYSCQGKLSQPWKSLKMPCYICDICDKNSLCMKIFEHFLLHLWQLWQRTI